MKAPGWINALWFRLPTNWMRASVTAPVASKWKAHFWRYRRLVIVVSLTLLYIFLLFYFFKLMGSIVFIFSLIPTIACAWQYGVRAAVAGSILLSIVDILFIQSVGSDALRLNVWFFIFSGVLTLLATGVTVGLVSGIGKRTHAELEERKKEHQILQAAIEAERVQRQMAESLRETITLLTSTLEVNDVLDRIITNIQKFVSYDAINIMLVEQGRVRAARYQGYAERSLQKYIEEFDQKAANVPGFKWMMENKKPLVVPDTQGSQVWLNFSATSWIRSFAGLPLIHRGEIIGFLNLNSATPGNYQSDFVDKLQPFADQAALAIKNARDFEAIQESTRRLSALNTASAELNKPVDYRATLHAAVNCFQDALGLDRVYLALFTKQWRLLICSGYSSTAEQFNEGDEILLYKDPAVAYVVEKKTSLLIQPGSHADWVDAALKEQQANGIAAQLLLPLVLGLEVIGVVGCQVCKKDRFFQQEEVDLSTAIANLAAVRIEQARIFDEERRQVSSLSLLHAASLEISMSTSQPDLLRNIAERATWLGNASGGSVYICDPQGRELVCKSSHNFPHNPEGSKIKFGEGAAGRVAESGKPSIVDDYGSWIYGCENFSGDDSPIALLTVPVIYRGRVTGVIQLYRSDPRNPFTLEETELLSLFSNQVAIALENTRLYEKIQEIAVRDPLTNLLNRRGLFEVAEREINRARRYRHPLSLCLMDIDHFKVVNDTYGHPVGDEVLQKVAQRLQLNLRSIDVLGRFGGEEFIFLVVENDLESTKRLAQRLGHFIAEKPFITRSGNVKITVSTGVVELSEEINDLQSLILAADQALYLAKHLGRNQVQVFSGKLSGN